MKAPSTFQRMVESLFKDLDFVQVYIDDLIISFNPKIYEPTYHPIVFCDLIKESGLEIKLKSTSLLPRESKCLDISYQSMELSLIH